MQEQPQPAPDISTPGRVSPEFGAYQSVPTSEASRRILVCPNAFKGSLTAQQAAQAISEGLAQALALLPHEIVCLPLADGGDGTLETLVRATNGVLHREWVRGPRGQAVEAAWGRLGGERHDTAIIEMAESSGLRLLSPEDYDPRVTTTYGVGQLMRAALRSGCRTLLLGIGGSATNDGGGRHGAGAWCASAGS